MRADARLVLVVVEDAGAQFRGDRADAGEFARVALLGAELRLDDPADDAREHADGRGGEGERLHGGVACLGEDGADRRRRAEPAGPSGEEEESDMVGCAEEGAEEEEDEPHAQGRLGGVDEHPVAGEAGDRAADLEDVEVARQRQAREDDDDEQGAVRAELVGEGQPAETVGSERETDEPGDDACGDHHRLQHPDPGTEDRADDEEAADESGVDKQGVRGEGCGIHGAGLLAQGMPEGMAVRWAAAGGRQAGAGPVPTSGRAAFPRHRRRCGRSRADRTRPSS
ncbi:Uncharacterised protein [Mycobacteroides abscessus subsp. abscessus]|nr:Uncharacterised protein [Mycobacteroides abscessus subsp. abscessus]